MSNLSNYQISWLKPAWTPDECVLASSIYVAIEVNQQNGSDVGFSTLSNFLRAVLPAPLNGASAGDLCDWWAKSWATNANDTANFVNSINDNCNLQVCDAVDWPGDPDIAGIGMIVVYGALLAIVYIYTTAQYMRHIAKLLSSSQFAWAQYIHHIIAPLGLLEQDESHEERLKGAVMDPFEGTIQDLFDLCVAFAITSEISTLAFHSHAVTRYEMVVAELLCLFASSASAVLWIFHSESGRFRVTRFVLFVTSVALPIAVIVEHATMREQMAEGFVMMCVDMKLDYITKSRLRDVLMFTGWAVMFAFQIGIAIIALPHAVYNYVSELLPEDRANICGPGRSRDPTSKRSRFLQWCPRPRFFHSKWFKVACAIGSMWGCIVMIASFVEILKMRSRMREVAGVAYNEDAWGFGQIFALTTWFPLLPTWLAIVFKGPQNGFNNRLPQAWKAIKKSMVGCNCAANNCQCRNRSQQPQTNLKAAFTVQEIVTTADADGIEEARPQENGTNTDWRGIKGCLLSETKDGDNYEIGQLALIIGAGAASRAAVYALFGELKCGEIYVVNRDAQEVADLLRDAQAYASPSSPRQPHLKHVTSVARAQALPAPFYIVGTVPDIEPKTEEELEAKEMIKTFLRKSKGALLDLCFNPRNTRTLRLGREQGWRAVDGTGVIGHQIEEQWRLRAGVGEEGRKSVPKEEAWKLLRKAADESKTINV